MYLSQHALYRSPPLDFLNEWYLFIPTSGQHVSFYTIESLRLLAARFGRILLSAGPYHLFSKTPKNGLAFRAWLPTSELLGL